jgi:hypothetical protein
MRSTTLKQPNNPFVRHPIKTLFIAVFLLATLILLGAEKYLSLSQPTFTTSGIQRFIRLKEHQPRGVGYVTPDAAYRAGAGGSLKEQYRLKIDGNGFIYPSKPHDSPDLSIVVLGGSTTESMFVDEDKRFPDLVQFGVVRQSQQDRASVEN